MKIVRVRTPESVTVDFDAIPPHQSEAMSRTLIGCIERLFQDPAIKADYEAWKQQRTQRLAQSETK